MDQAPGSSKRNDESHSIYSKITTEFQNNIIKETLRISYKDTKTKITEEALELVKEVTRAMVVEAAMRAAKEAFSENKTTVNVNHVENMILQMMLDFP
ncbi:centromere protein X-like [Photinus pyralis]|uniref:centromere protein X-like n=1 Tax=Photinus pyralis TaxID=7054 RepID=UPI0012673028|nr:centromere protein X-like [Photinus pyralis]